MDAFEGLSSAKENIENWIPIHLSRLNPFQFPRINADIIVCVRGGYKDNLKIRGAYVDIYAYNKKNIIRIYNFKRMSRANSNECITNSVFYFSFFFF